MPHPPVAHVVCVGALHVDAKARVTGSLIPGTSNPAAVVRTAGGVAANVARTLARLEVAVSLVSVVGDDDAGHRLLARLAAEGVGVDEVVVTSAASTATYLAVLQGSGELAFGIADMGIYDGLDATLLEPLLHRHHGAVWCVDANTAPSGLEAVAAAGIGTLVLDPVSVAKALRLLPLLAGATAVFPDGAEAHAITGSTDAAVAAARLVASGVGLAVVSHGADGVVVGDSSGITARPAIAAHVVDVTGAGDALLAGYLAALARGEEDPVGWGLAAASLTVETMDTVRDDLTVEGVRERLR